MYLNFDSEFIFSKKIAAHEDEIRSLQFSPSTHFLASAGGDKKILLTYILSKGFNKKEYIETPHTNIIDQLIYKEENILYSCGGDNLTCKFDLETSKCVRAYNCRMPCLKADVNSWSSLLMVSNTEEILFFDERASFRPILKLEREGSKCEFRKNSTEFIVSSCDAKLEMYDFRNTTKALRKYDTEDIMQGSTDAVFNYNGTLILLSPVNYWPIIFSPEKETRIGECVMENPMTEVSFKTYRFGGPQDEYVLCGFDDKIVNYCKLKPDNNEIEKNVQEIVNNMINSESKSKKNEENRKNKRLKALETLTLHKTAMDNYFSINLQKKKPYVPKIYFFREKYKNIHLVDEYKTLKGFNSIVSIAVMHSKIPIIFCGGIENCIYAFAPFYIGENDEYEQNYDLMQRYETFLEDAYGPSIS